MNSPMAAAASASASPARVRQRAGAGQVLNVHRDTSRGRLNEIGTGRKYRGPVMVITYRLTSLSGEDRFVYMCSRHFS